jgi:hypothetical protein
MIASRHKQDTQKTIRVVTPMVIHKPRPLIRLAGLTVVVVWLKGGGV